MYEVEVKIKVKDNEDFTSKLIEMGAQYKADLLHVDSYFNLPEGLRDFEKTDEALRIRKSTEFNYDEISQELVFIKEACDFTYKGPKIDKETKSRIEHVIKISDFDAMENILNVLGFRKVITVEKNRKLYHLLFEKLPIEIVFDKIQFLNGNYAEFETIAEKIKDIPDIKSKIFKLMKKLGYLSNDSITKSYLELVVKSQNSKKK